jgi:hypothetical protein
MAAASMFRWVLGFNCNAIAVLHTHCVRSLLDLGSEFQIPDGDREVGFDRPAIFPDYSLKRKAGEWSV